MPQIIVHPWCPDNPRRVLLHPQLSNDYLHGKAEAVIQDKRMTDIRTYLKELFLVASKKKFNELLHIASPETVKEIEEFLAYNFDSFPVSIFLPSESGKDVLYVISSPDVKDNSAVFYLASVMRG